MSDPGARRRRLVVTAEQTAPACRAALTSLYLDPKGNVQACCMNTWHRLGTIPHQRLLDIWRGDAANGLRAALANGDLSHGCELCAANEPAQAYARAYDDLVPATEDPAWPVQLELALTNACNLQCTMCNGDLSSAIRIHREHRPPLPTVYDDAFFDDLATFLPHLTNLNFVGGEPFLGAESLRVLHQVSALESPPICHVTTNGTQWSERIAATVANLPIHIAVSLDAFEPETYRAIRIGADPDRVWENVAAIRLATDRPGAGMSLTYCLMRQNWRELHPFLAWADRLDVDVFVNQVDYPSTHSLRHLPAQQLAEMADHWRRQEADGPALQRNAAVWEQERERLASLRTHRSPSSEGKPVAMHPTSPNTDAAAFAASLAGSQGVTTVIANSGMQVIAVTPETADAPDLSSCVGHTLHDILASLESMFGERGAMELLPRDDGIEVRRLTFTRGTVTTTVFGTHAPGQTDDLRWHFAVQPGAQP